MTRPFLLVIIFILFIFLINCSTSPPLIDKTTKTTTAKEPSKKGFTFNFVPEPTEISSEHIQKSLFTQAKNGDLEVIIIYDPKREINADYHLKKTALYLPAMEKYLGEELFFDKVALICSEEEGHAYQRGNTINLFNKHIAGAKGFYSGVVFHEFGHFYFSSGGYSELSWFAEGVNSFLPLAIVASGYLKEDDLSLNGIKGVWHLKDPIAAEDYPCIEDFRGISWRYFYSKSFKIQYMIFKELGKDTYQKFLQDVLSNVLYNPDSKDPIKGLISTLKKHKNINWNDFLSGWVFKGEYKKFTFDDFKDKDKNGIIDIDEL